MPAKARFCGACGGSLAPAAVTVAPSVATTPAMQATAVASAPATPQSPMPTPAATIAPMTAGADASPAAHPAGFTAPAVWSFIGAALCAVVGFSSPGYLLGALALGAYGWRLYSGGRDFTGVMADGRPRARAWVGWALATVLAISVGFDYSLAFLVALGTGGYAAYLFSGGRDATRVGIDGTPRSAVWLYYAAICVGGIVLGVHYPACFAVSAVAAAYSTYLFRGGRWILWIW